MRAARPATTVRERPVPAGGPVETTLTFVGGSCSDKWLKSRVTSEDEAFRGPRAHAAPAGDVPYGRGLRYRGSPTDGLSTESPFQIMNACQDSGAVEPRR
ncbi:hypothetical protein GCM10018782_22260 [Streptomyces griseoaurantiacus]|nr:hypothetical protein GCM10018782_22260 [Streptomyces griseoaurantiacus]